MDDDAAKLIKREDVNVWAMDRYTLDLVPWQSPNDLPERRLMVQRIIAMTRRHKRRMVVGMEEAWDEKTPSLAKRIELTLYSRAASFEEYKDLNTLRRRLQSLVSLSFHEAASLKTKRHDVEDPRRAKKCKIDTVSSVFLIDNEDLVRHIYGYLDGKDVLRHTAVSKKAALLLPTCVLTLSLCVNKLALAFELQRSTFLIQMVNLESLDVSNPKMPYCEANEADIALHAWGCSELDISQDNIGEDVVLELASAIQAGACAKLRRLRLVSAFTNTCRRNAIQALCASLNSCPLLEDLLLGGNSFSDSGTVDIAALLRQGALPNLVRLDLRRNYIGESGLKRIMHAFGVGHCSKLKYLCMGGNIITDNSVEPVIQLLSSSLCPQLRFLGLEDNFISARGVQSIIEAAVAGGMMPKLHKVAQ
ncbi:tyrosine-protein phosphatase required for protection against superoxide stress (By similarity) [Aphanomyces cochlioides]|nr:tyrosine-protein phosphatase required for protection against superoxide stress (By similarity) [Aphanomyces cochlioides]